MAAGWQSLVGAQFAVQNGTAQSFVELAVQRQSVFCAQPVHLGQQKFGQHGRSENASDQAGFAQALHGRTRG